MRSQCSSTESVYKHMKWHCAEEDQVLRWRYHVGCYISGNGVANFATRSCPVLDNWMQCWYLTKSLAVLGGHMSVDSTISILRNWMCISWLSWTVCIEASVLLRSPTKLRVNKLLYYVLRAAKPACIVSLRKWVTEFNNLVIACHLLHVFLLMDSLGKIIKRPI